MDATERKKLEEEAKAHAIKIRKLFEGIAATATSTGQTLSERLVERGPRLLGSLSEMKLSGGAIVVGTHGFAGFVDDENGVVHSFKEKKYSEVSFFDRVYGQLVKHHDYTMHHVPHPHTYSQIFHWKYHPDAETNRANIRAEAQQAYGPGHMVNNHYRDVLKFLQERNILAELTNSFQTNARPIAGPVIYGPTDKDAAVLQAHQSSMQRTLDVLSHMPNVLRYKEFERGLKSDPEIMGVISTMPDFSRASAVTTQGRILMNVNDQSSGALDREISDLKRALTL